MPVMTRLKRVLQDPDKHLARARRSEALGDLLSPYTDAEIKRLAARYQSGDLSKQVNAQFAGTRGGARLAPTLAKLSDENLSLLRAEHETCGPCKPPPLPPPGDGR